MLKIKLSTYFQLCKSYKTQMSSEECSDDKIVHAR